jgi:hypothetical protein
MTIISTIDASSSFSQQDGRSSLKEDFAQALAKHAAHEASNASLGQEARFKAAMVDEEYQSRLSNEGQESEASISPTIDLQQSESIPVLLATEQQLRLSEIVVAPIGITEATLGTRLFGWHTQAQPYLSELDPAEEAGERDVFKDDMTKKTPTSKMQYESSISTSEGSNTGSEFAASATPVAGSSDIELLSMPSDEVASASLTIPVQENASPTAYWAERSLRFTRHADGKSVAWLRDFRADESELPQLIAMAISDAKAKGLTLSKIMLNGREAWSSPNEL